MSSGHEWFYPEIQHITDDLANISEVKRLTLEQAQKQILDKINYEKDLILSEKEHLNQLIDSYKQKLKTVNQLITSLEEAHHFFGEELKVILKKYISAIVTRVTHQTIDENAKILECLINDVKNQLQPSQHPISIKISSIDMKHVDQLDKKIAALCEEDSSLKRGDIVIHTGLSAISSHLQDRIDALVKIGVGE